MWNIDILNAIRDIEKYWYQIETVKKVLRYFHGW